MIAEGTQRATARPSSAARSRGYLVYLVILMGLVAVMDQYLSTVKTTAIPYILKQYNISAAQFSWLEALFLIPTFFIFALNGLNDIIGRRLSILVLVLLMGASAVGILAFTPGLYAFMAFYALATFTTVSNMWTIPISEEAPAQSRAKYVAVVFVLGLLPLQAVLPPLLVNKLGLDWRWMYGVVAGMGLIAIVVWLWMRETERFARVREEQRAGRLKSHVFGLGSIDRRDFRYIAISASIWICWLLNSMLYYWTGYYFMDVRGYTLSQWSMVLLGTLIMAMLGGVAGGAIMDRLGRRVGLVIGCLGLAVVLPLFPHAQGTLLPILAAISGFFTSLSYSWIVVYVPEVFPTERRGACMGWTTTLARVAFVGGPVLAASLLQVSPKMELFWLVAGLIMLLPIVIIFLLRPFETKTQELEEIAERR